MRVSEAAKWVLTSSEGDWVPATVANMAVDKAEDMPGLLRELTEKGLAEIGDVSGVCFSAWAGSPAEVVSRAVASLNGSNRVDQIHCFWINLTDSGHRLAKELASR